MPSFRTLSSKKSLSHCSQSPLFRVNMVLIWKMAGCILSRSFVTIFNMKEMHAAMFLHTVIFSFLLVICLLPISSDVSCPFLLMFRTWLCASMHDGYSPRKLLIYAISQGQAGGREGVVAHVSSSPVLTGIGPLPTSRAAMHYIYCLVIEYGYCDGSVSEPRRSPYHDLLK